MAIFCANLLKPTSYRFLMNNVAHYLLFVFLASSYLLTTQMCLGDGLPSAPCIEEERRALLSFKEDIFDFSDRLSSWGDQNCCRWEGISCNNRTGHVARMNLRNPNYVREWNTFDGGTALSGKINPSLLILKNLYYLDLSGNYFDELPIPNFFGNLTSLRYLNLSYASFVGEIPPALGNLTNLNYLDLNLAGELHPKNLNWLKGLPSLKYLDLGGVNLSSTGKSWLHDVNMLPSLLELHLSDCHLDENQLPLSLPTVNFTSLLVVDISKNFINSSFPSWFFNLTNLKKLVASGISFSPIPVEFANFKSLEELDISFNHLKGQIPKVIGILCSLRILDLSSNLFTGGLEEVLNGFSNCTEYRLESLVLSHNKMEGELPATLGMLENLKELNLQSNFFFGSIPESIGNLSSLETLDISENHMNESIPSSLGQLSQLVHLDLSENAWKGNLTEAHFRTLTKLKVFAITTGRHMSLFFNMTQNWVPLFQLDSLNIVNCIVGPAFGAWLQSQTELTWLVLRNTRIRDSIPEEWWVKMSFKLTRLDLSSNQIGGKLPFHMNFSSLFHIRLSHNQFEGPLPHWSSDAAGFLDLRSNLLSGPIPSNFGQLLPNLGLVFLSDNHLNGSIPPSLCNMSGLQVLVFRNNHLSGEFPRAWSSSLLKVVDFSDNNLSGNLPTSISSSLLVLDLSKNEFEGQIPSSLFQNSSDLFSVDLGGNRLTGGIPIRGQESSLRRLQLRANSLSGHIPNKLCSLPHLHIIDLGRNNFSGTIPKCLCHLNMTSLSVVDEQLPFYPDDYLETTDLILKGQELPYSTNLRLVNIIDFSLNNLEGVIPEGIGNLVALGTLNLSKNHLTGNIPSDIGKLRWLETLDLSHNHLSGQIPQTLSSLTSLSHLDLSHNNLSGRIPSGNQFQTLDNSSIYEGNPSLCGFPLETPCPGDAARTPAEHDEDDQDGEDNDENEKFGMYVSATLGFIIGFWSVCGTLVLKKSWRYAYFRFFDNIPKRMALAIA